VLVLLQSVSCVAAASSCSVSKSPVFTFSMSGCGWCAAVSYCAYAEATSTRACMVSDDADRWRKCRVANKFSGEVLCTAPGSYPRPPACSKLLFTQCTSLQNLKVHKFLRILSTSQRKASIKPVQFRPLHSATNAAIVLLDSSARWRNRGCWTAAPFSTLTADSTAPLGLALAFSPTAGSLFREEVANWGSSKIVLDYVFFFQRPIIRR
jgi:hypothetical protein